ncbi:unnamed protein product [Arabidopsis halleri]
MASILMLLRALMSCRLTPKDEPDTADSSSSAVKINMTRKRISVVDTSHSHRGDNHEFIIETTCGSNDMDEGFYWIIVRNHLLM